MKYIYYSFILALCCTSTCWSMENEEEHVPLLHQQHQRALHDLENKSSTSSSADDDVEKGQTDDAENSTERLRLLTQSTKARTSEYERSENLAQPLRPEPKESCCSLKSFRCSYKDLLPLSWCLMLLAGIYIGRQNPYYCPCL